MPSERAKPELIRFATVVAEALARSPMSQTELAERLGVSRGAVGNWKAGTDQPKPHRLPEIERELELQPGTLVSALANTDDRDELLGSRVRALEVRVGQLEEEIEQIRSRS